MTVPAPTAAPGPAPASVNFKAIVPRRRKQESGQSPAAAEGRRRSLRRLAILSRDSRRSRRTENVQPQQPQLQQEVQQQRHAHQQQEQQQQQHQVHHHQQHQLEPAGYSEHMVFFNPDGSIPAPAYSGHMEPTPHGETVPGGAGTGTALGGAGEYAQLQTVQPEHPPPPPPGEFRPQAECEVPHGEIERYAADYGVYLGQDVPPQQQDLTQQGQGRQACKPPTTAPGSAATGNPSASDAHQVPLEDDGDPLCVYKEVPRICKPCGEPISPEMFLVRKHFVESHMGLERNDLTGCIVYRCGVCAAKVSTEYRVPSTEFRVLSTCCEGLVILVNFGQNAS